MTSLEVLKLVSGGSSLIPAVASLFRWLLLVRRFPALLAYVWLVVLVEGLGMYANFAGVKSNTILYNCFSLGELTLLGLLYHRQFDRSGLRALALGFIAGFWGLALYRFAPNPHADDSLVISVESLMLIALVLLYFYRLLHNLEATRLSRFPMFWFSAGILMFFSGTLFIYMFSEYLVKNKNFPRFNALWNVSYYVNVVFHLALTVGIYHVRRLSERQNVGRPALDELQDAG